MTEIGAPLLTLDANGTILRVFRPKPDAIGLPWFSLADLLDATGMASVSSAIMIAAYRTSFVDRYRTIAIGSERLTVVDYETATLFVWTLQGWGLLHETREPPIWCAIHAAVAAYADERFPGDHVGRDELRSLVLAGDWFTPGLKDAVIEMVGENRAHLFRIAHPSEHVS